MHLDSGRPRSVRQGLVWLRRSRLAQAIAWTAAAVSAGWAVIRTFGLEDGFPLVALIAFTPYVVPFALFAAVLAASARRWVAFGAAALAFILLASAVAPRMFGDGPAVPGADGPQLRVAGANLKLGGADPDAVVAIVREHGIDVLCVQELTPGLAARLQSSGLEALLPHGLVRAAPGSAGSAIYSRHPLRPRPGVEPPGYGFVMPRAAIDMPGAVPFDVASVHTNPPTNSAGVEAWKAGLEALPAASDSAPLSLLVGDFNATLDHATFRGVVDRGYVDAGDATGQGLRPTWPQRFRPKVTIDHVLADARIAVERYDTIEVEGGDHRAVTATLQLPGDSAAPLSRLAAR